MSDATLIIEPFIVELDAPAERVRALCEPVIESEGCSLILLQVIRGHEAIRVRFFIDTKSHDSHVGLGDLEKLNRLLGDLLDVEDGHEGLFNGNWDLEVSSPGVDRPLSKRSHFEAAIGEQVKLKTKRAIPNLGRSFSGVIEGLDDEGLQLLPEGGAKSVHVSFDDLVDARKVFQFEAASKPKTKRKKKKS
ncbi:MAG: ribosome maturation factor RimP [Deltaproteobacteria bacterium]|nr:ribosome maturation factor RimP [Deltaproteobacteria bacterium]